MVGRDRELAYLNEPVLGTPIYVGDIIYSNGVLYASRVNVYYGGTSSRSGVREFFGLYDGKSTYPAGEPLAIGYYIAPVITKLDLAGKSLGRYPEYIPKGIIVYIGNGDYVVTNKITTMGELSGNVYHNLKPYGLATYAAGDYFVYHDAIYQVSVDVTITTSNISNYLPWNTSFATGVQDAPASRLDTVLPHSLFDTDYGLVRPIGTFLAARSTQKHSTDALFPLTAAGEDRRDIYITYTNSNTSTAKFSFDGTLPTAVSVRSTKDYFIKTNPYGTIPDSCFNGQGVYGASSLNLGSCYSDGNMVTNVVSDYVFPVPSGYNWTTDLKLEKFIIHARQKIPLTVFDIVNVSSDIKYCIESGDKNCIVLTNGIPQYTAPYHYDVDDQVVRNFETAQKINVYPLAITGGVLADPIEGIPSYLKKNAVGYLLEGDIDLFCIQATKDITKDSLLKNLILFERIDECLIKIYYVLKDDILSRTDMHAFLNNEEFCEYWGIYDTCDGTYKSITLRAGAKIKAGILTIRGDNIYIPKSSYTATSNKDTRDSRLVNTAKVNGKTVVIEDDEEAIRDKLKDVRVNTMPAKGITKEMVESGQITTPNKEGESSHTDTPTADQGAFILEPLPDEFEYNEVNVSKYIECIWEFGQRKIREKITYSVWDIVYVKGNYRKVIRKQRQVRSVEPVGIFINGEYYKYKSVGEIKKDERFIDENYVYIAKEANVTLIARPVYGAIIFLQEYATNLKKGSYFFANGKIYKAGEDINNTKALTKKEIKKMTTIEPIGDTIRVPTDSCYEQEEFVIDINEIPDCYITPAPTPVVPVTNPVKSPPKTNSALFKRGKAVISILSPTEGRLAKVGQLEVERKVGGYK